MDAFYASVEMHDYPDLRGKPVLVGSDRRRGVVSAASYEARLFGCHSAQPMRVALRLCPDAVVAKPRFQRYSQVSKQVFRIFRDFTPLVEPLSIDEAFLDVTGTDRLFGTPIEIAEKIRARIREEVGITASVGVAPNKFLAKLASDLEKPDGLTVVTPETVAEILAPLAIERMWGVGPVTAKKMHQYGIRTIGELARRPGAELARLFGSAGEHFARLARGADDRPVETRGEVKSVSHEVTFEEDLEDKEDVRRVLLHLTEDVGRRVRRQGLQGRTITVKIRYGDFETITRSATLDAATDATEMLWGATSALFDRWARGGYRPVRLIGMGVSHLETASEQLQLFQEPGRERARRLDSAVDQIRDRYGADAIRRHPDKPQPGS
jgi:DNA polymerase-4